MLNGGGITQGVICSLMPSRNTQTDKFVMTYKMGENPALQKTQIEGR